MRDKRTVRARARRGPLLWVLVFVALANLPGVARAQGAPSVAVLEFRVHSAEPRGDLADALADAVRTQLTRDDRVRVVDTEGRGAPEPRDGESRDAALRRFAREIGADYLVTGSMTQLAGRFSLDLRLTAAAVGLASDTQIITSQSEDELLERLGSVADRIVARVVGAAPAKVAAVEIRGSLGFEEHLLDRLETRVGQPYDPLTVRADLSTLRSTAMVVSADAQTERTEQGVVVLFDVVLADPSLALAEADDQRIAEIQIRGNRRIEAGAIRARIGSKVGEPYNPNQISRDISEIHALGFFRNVRVLGDRSDQGLVLIFEVEENPIVRQISISGNENIEGDKIRDSLTLTTGSTLDHPLLFENRQRIEALYRADGFYLAGVTFEIEPLGEAAVGIHFNIDEKEKLKLREIVFEGNEHFSDSELGEGFQTRTWRFWSYATSWLDNSGTYSEPLFFQDLRRVERKYTDAGYLQARVGKPEVRVDDEGIVVAVDIEEGELFRVGQIDVTGDSTVDIDSLRGKLKLKEGAVFNRSFLNDDIAALTEHYQDRGFYFAQVNFVSNLSEASEAVDVDFEVRKGPLYFIRRVDIEGNGITRDPVVRREIPIAEGQLYSQRTVLLARSRVERLGFFEEVDFRMQPTDEPDQLDLKVSVVERPTGSLSFGAGFSSQDGLAVNGSLSQSNLFGRGYGANISLDLGRDTQRFFVNLSDPYFMGSTFSLSASARGQTFEFEDFEQTEVGVEVAVGHTLTDDNRTRGFARYSFDLKQLEDDRNVNAAAVIFREILQDQISTSLVGLSVLSDTRDDRLAPTAGHRLGVNLEAAGIGGFTKFARLEASGTWFLGAPSWLLERSSFVFGARVGWAIPFNVIGDFDTPDLNVADAFLLGNQVQALDDIDDDLTLPLTDRYILGGLGRFQLRGFKGRSVGPRRPILQPVGTGSVFAPLGFDALTGACDDSLNGFSQGNLNGVCNDLGDRDIDDFEDLDETDVVGGNKFITSTFEYRFPISETVGLQGVAFIDMGNAFDERTYNLLDVTEWRYGTGVGVQWFSPFGPLAVVLGFPLDRLSFEKSPVFEFSIGGSAF